MTTEASAPALSRSRKLWKAGRRDEALATLDAALVEQPQDRGLILRRCSFLCELGRPQEAVAILQELQRLLPEDAAVVVELARAHGATGAYAAALALLESLAEADPSQHDVLVARVDMLVALERLDAALAAVGAALARHAEDRRLLHRRGTVLRRLGRTAEAVGVLSPLHRRYPEDADLAMDLALALGAMGEHEASMAALDSILARNPIHRAAWRAKIDAAVARSDQDALASLARGFFERLASGGGSGAAMLLAQVLPHLHLGRWGPEAAAWIGAVCPHGDKVRPANLWALHGMAELLGRPEHGRELLARLLARPSLPLAIALGMLRWSHAASPAHYGHMSSELRTRLSAEALRLFELERVVLEQGPAEAVRARQRRGKRHLEEVILLLSLMPKAGLLPQALRYAALARRAHPANAELRRSWLALLDAAGEAEQALLLAETMLAPSAGACVKDQQAAIGTLISLGHGARALELLDLLETPGNRRSFRPLRLELMLRFGKLDEARALVAEVTTFGNARRAMHFRLTGEGRQFTELEIVEASRDKGGSAQPEGQFVGPSVLALDAHMARLPKARGEGPGRIPRRIMQYWNTGHPPRALDDIMATWRRAEGFRYRLYDRASALAFLREEFSAEWADALRMANHASEESDFFRLAFLAARGGIYADCDDMLIGSAEGLTAGASGLVVYRERKGTIANNLILAEAAHPVVVRAAVAAKQALLRKDNDSTWSKTGPGLLTRIVALVLGEAARGDADAGVTIRRVQDAARHVRCHIALPYKKSARYWNAHASGGHMATTPPPLP